MGTQGTKRSFPCQPVLASVHSASARKQWIDPTIVFSMAMVEYLVRQ